MSVANNENNRWENSGLSKRGTEALSRPPLLKCAVFECQFTPSRRNGLINLGVAENSLMTEWLIDYFQRSFKLEYSDFTYGTALPGSLRLFKALGHLLKTHFNARRPVLQEHIIAGSGCGSVIDLLVAQIADPGDGILVSIPHYNGFVASFSCRNSVETVGVRLPPGREAEADGIEYFERALAESEARGVKIRAIMICNPHNPMGFCYKKSVLLEYLRFAQRHNIHLISDEIYALSVYDTEQADAVRFTSVLSLDPMLEAGCCPSRVHVIYGASKDWSANGLRLGALISQSNPALHTAMESSCLLMKVSSVADALWSALLLDPVALPEYLELNRSRLSAAYADAVRFLRSHDIPFRPGNAGHFIWIDLRKFAPTKSRETGETLAEGWPQEEEMTKAFTECGVIVARGAAYGHTVPGFFRLTFTVRNDYFQLGLGRLERALGLKVTRGLEEERRLDELATDSTADLKRGTSTGLSAEGRERVEEALDEVNEALAASVESLSVKTAA